MKVVGGAFAALFILSACGGGGEEPADTDPYATYLELAPDGAPRISEDDAATRALLGCETDWPAGSVDAALAQAYRPTGLCDG